MPDTYLVTGTAGFIGYHVAERLLGAGHRVVGLDNVNPYYDPALKEARVARLKAHARFVEARVSLEDRSAVLGLFGDHGPDVVINLAAQAGVRYSLESPETYVSSNVDGFLSILEGCRHHGVRHLVYASTSSVYGLNKAMPFSVHQVADHPMTIYAATKKANEMMAHSYSHLFDIPTTGLRFFTVYGPWGRPDMALFKFTEAILAGRPIDVYNHGEMSRDFTYIDDIAEGVVRVAATVPTINRDWSATAPDPATSGAGPFRLYNIGNSRPVSLMTYIECLEAALGRKAEKNLLPMQPGDVPETWADVDDLVADTGFRPATSVEDGVRAFVEWYRSYY